MATARLFLDDRKLKGDGTAPIKIVIRNKGTQAHMPTGFCIPPSCWKDGKVVNGKGLDKPATFINAGIRKMMTEVEAVLLEVSPYKSNKSASFLRDLIVYRLKGEKPSEGDCDTFIEAYAGYVSSIKKKSSKAFARIVGNFLKRNVPNIDKIGIGDIDEAFAQKLKDILLDRVANNTAANYFSMVKSSWHWMQKNGVSPKDEFPFEEVRFKMVSTRSRALTIDEVRRIWNTPIPKGLTQKKERNFREGLDAFKLYIGLAGINFVDLYYLTTNDIRGERLECDRSKTGVHINLRIEPEVKEILDRYTDERGFLIGKLTEWKWGKKSDSDDKAKDSPQTRALERVNTRLKLLDPKLTSYWCRHTWASLCAELDIPDRTISMGLAHAYGNAMDNVYITNRVKKLDDANRRVLDWIQQKGEFSVTG